MKRLSIFGMISALLVVVGVSLAIPAASEDAQGASSVEASPATVTTPPTACDAKMNYIHKSTSSGTWGKVKVYASTSCGSTMEIISVSIKLYRESPTLTLIGTSPSPIAYGSKFIGRSAVGDACKPGWYRASADHYAKLGSYVFRDSSSDRRYLTCS